MATASVRRRTVALSQPDTVADLLRRLGRIPAFRVRLNPPPGTATEKDVVRYNESKLVLPGFRLAVRDVFDSVE